MVKWLGLYTSAKRRGTARPKGTLANARTRVRAGINEAVLLITGILIAHGE